MLNVYNDITLCVSIEDKELIEQKIKAFGGIVISAIPKKETPNVISYHLLIPHITIDIFMAFFERDYTNMATIVL